MDYGSTRGISHRNAETIKRFHDVVVEHLVGNNREHGRNIRRRFFEDHVGTAVDRNKRAGRGCGNTERQKVPTARILKRATGKNIRVAAACGNADFYLDGWHGTCSFFRFDKPFAVST